MLTMFGKRLRSLRIENDERLKDMANKLGVTVAYLSAVENGKRTVPDSWLEILEDKYSLSNEEMSCLQSLAYENKKIVKISIENANDAETGLVLSFARKFKSLTDEEMLRLQKILDEN